MGKDKHGDNLGVYDDGSCYCWACGYYIHGSITAKLQGLRRAQELSLVSEINQTPPVVLPPDSDVYIPAVARDWLGKYVLSEHEIVKNRFMWSQYREMLLFPYFDKYNNLVAWQGRSFSATPFNIRRHTKWYSQGDVKSLFHIITPEVKQVYDFLVVSEDIVSTIKIGRHFPSLCLFGNNISNRVKTLYNLTNHLVIWIDPDMKKKSITEAFKAQQLGLKTSIVFSDKDPKEYDNSDIVHFVQTAVG